MEFNCSNSHSYTINMHKLKAIIKYGLQKQIEGALYGFLALASRHPPSHNTVTVGEEGWWRPSLLPTTLSYQALVVYLMSLDLVLPIPFPLPPHPLSRYLFWCFDVLLFCPFLCFLGFFVVSTDLLYADFAALHPLLGFFIPPLRRASIVLFFVRGQRTRDWFLSLYFFLLVFSFASFLFPVFRLLFTCNNALASMV
jgi:hypothetical protein